MTKVTVQRVGIGLGILVLIFAGTYFALSREQSHTQTGADLTEGTNSSSGYSYSNSTEFYNVEVSLAATGHRKADSVVRRDVSQLVQRFEADYKPENFKDEDKSVLFPNGNPWSGSWKGRVSSKAGAFTNYRIDMYEYTGGAHGNPALRVYVFDSNGMEVGLNDIFLKSSDYENRLSTLAREYLLTGKTTDPTLADSLQADPSILQDDFVYSGTEPNADNFNNFALEHAGIRISFNTYQVASYALGQPEIIIPWDKVKDIIRPEILEQVHSE